MTHRLCRCVKRVSTRAVSGPPVRCPVATCTACTGRYRTGRPDRDRCCGMSDTPRQRGSGGTGRRVRPQRGGWFSSWHQPQSTRRDTEIGESRNRPERRHPRGSATPGDGVRSQPVRTDCTGNIRWFGRPVANRPEGAQQSAADRRPTQRSTFHPRLPGPT